MVLTYTELETLLEDKMDELDRYRELLQEFLTLEPKYRNAVDNCDPACCFEHRLYSLTKRVEEALAPDSKKVDHE